MATAAGGQQEGGGEDREGRKGGESCVRVLFKFPSVNVCDFIAFYNAKRELQIS